MKRIYYLLIALLALTGCSKNKNDVYAPPTGADAKIKTWANNSAIYTYTYDAQGRTVKDESSNGSAYEYEYSAGKIKMSIFSAGHTPFDVYTYELNTDGLVTKETRNSDPAYQSLTVYNPDKTTAKTITTQGGGTYSQDFFYNNGNYDSIRNTGKNGLWQSTIVRTYYTDKPNVLDGPNWGEYHFALLSKNLLKTEQYKYNDGTMGQLTTCTYEFDAKGRVIKQINQGSNTSISLLTYY